MAIGDNIKRLRLAHGLSQIELGQIAGVTDKAVSTWETGEKIPRMGAIERMAAYFGIMKSEIIDGEEEPAFQSLSKYGILPLPNTYKVPRLGTIACGVPILAEENIEAYDDVPENIHCDFTLKCAGDSMIGARIHDGDIVYIKMQPDVENGEIAAVLIDETADMASATLKRVYKYPNQLVLQAENHKYAPLVFAGEDMNHVRIVGRAVGFTSVIR